MTSLLILQQRRPRVEFDNKALSEMLDGRCMVQTSDKSTIAIPRVATFHTSERKRNTPAAYKAR
jgi:hypothetical protein